ncbi:MAG: hypothetical protein NUV74_04175 [Candidatus Brocadiaceae bacterium]|nr:hypothetical protein [Candidatus Brocadiaceae bacterium]
MLIRIRRHDNKYQALKWLSIQALSQQHSLFQRRVIGIRNRCSAYYADQSNPKTSEVF